MLTKGRGGAYEAIAAGTVIVVSSIVIRFLTSFGSVNGTFGMVEELYEDDSVVTDEYVAQVADRMGIPEDEAEPMDDSLLARVAQPASVVFKPLGFGDWKPTAVNVTGLVAKEEVVANFGIMYAYDDQEREEELDENGDQIWDRVADDFNAFSGGMNVVGLVIALVMLGLLCFQLFRPYKEAYRLTVK